MWRGWPAQRERRREVGEVLVRQGDALREGNWVMVHRSDVGKKGVLPAGV